MRRILIVGDTAVARGLRTLIERDTMLQPAGMFKDMTITIEEGPQVAIVVDSIDNAFEREVVTHIRKVIAPDGQPAHDAGIIVAAERSADAQRQDRMTITVPAGNDREAFAVEHGIYRALLDAARPRTRRWGWKGKS